MGSRFGTYPQPWASSAAAIAGFFGMNFQIPIFNTGRRGFYTDLSALAAMSLLAAMIARRNEWI